MGNIIYAEGGEGGRGGISKTGSVLPKFDKEIYDLEERCYGKSGADRPAECNVFGSGSDYKFHIVSVVHLVNIRHRLDLRQVL